MKALKSHFLLRLLFVILSVCATGWFVYVGLNALWGNVYVLFYGRLVDQFGNALPSATVSGYVSSERLFTIPLPGADNQVRSSVSAVTDRNGYFALHAGYGWSLHFRDVTAKNYSYFCNADYYYSKYNASAPLYLPDSRKPTIIRVFRYGVP